MTHCKYFHQITVITLIAVLILKMIIIVIYAMPMKLMTQIIRYNSLIIINIVVVKRNMRMVIVKNINHVKENDKTQIITVLNPKLLLYFK